MSIHTVAKEITVMSEVEVAGYAGSRTELIAKIACKEVSRVCENIELEFLRSTDIHVGRPIYQEGNMWLVSITTIFRSTSIAELED